MSIKGSFQFQPPEGDQYTVFSYIRHIFSAFQMRYLTFKGTVHSEMPVLPFVHSYVVQEPMIFFLAVEQKWYFENFFSTEEIEVCCFGTTGEQLKRECSFWVNYPFKRL